MKQKYELDVEIILSSRCNYNCEYCFNNTLFQNVKKKLLKPKFYEYTNTINLITSLGLKTRIGLTGGEPFLYPSFIGLCKLITQNHSLYVSTNLSSQKINDFASEINPKKVDLIYISYHLGKNEIGRFTKKIKLLEKEGFPYKIIYVMYPPRIESFENIRLEFKKSGIIIHPKHFIGKYKNKAYPNSYTSEELKYFTEDFKNSYKEMKTRGLMCMSGMSCLRIKGDKVYRCWTDKNPISNIKNIELLTNPKACKMNSCNCISEYEKYLIKA